MRNKPHTVIRSARARLLLSPAEKLELDQLYDKFLDLGQKLQTKVYSFSGLTLKDRNENVVVDGALATPKEKAAWETFINSTQSTPMAGPFLRKEFKDMEKVLADIERKQAEYDTLASVPTDKMTPKAVTEHNKKLKQAKGKLDYSQSILLLNQLRQEGCLPVRIGDEQFVEDYHKSLMSSVHGRAKSWNECNLATQEEAKALEAEFDALLVHFGKKYPTTTSSLAEYAEAVRKHNEEYTDTSYLNYKFLSFLKTCWRPHALATGEGLLSGTWTVKSKKTKKDVEISYTFNEICNKELLARPELWKDEKSILMDEKMATYFELLDRRRRKKWQSSLTLITNESPIPMGYDFRGNLVTLKSLSVDNVKHTITATVLLPKKNDEAPEVERSYTATYGRRGETKQYFTDLKYTPIVSKTTNKKDTEVKTTQHILTYSRYGKVPVTAELGTIFIRRYGNGEYEFVLPLNVQVESHSNHPFTHQELFSLGCKFKTAWKSVRKNKRTKANNCKLEDEVAELLGKNSLKMVGLDLGMNNVYAYQEFLVSGKKGYSYTPTGEAVILKSVEDGRYYDLKEKCYALKSWIRLTRAYLQSSELKLTLSKRLVESFSKLNLSCSMDDYVKKLEKWKSEKLLVKDLKGLGNGWDLSQTFIDIIKQFNAYKHEHSIVRKKEVDVRWNIHTTPEWLRLCEAYYDLQKCFNQSGDGLRQDKDKKRLTIREEDFCGNLLRYIDNLKDYYCKYIFGNLALELHNKGVSFVAIEDNLSSLAGNKNNLKEENKIFNMWPRGQYTKRLTDALAYYNIEVIEVNGNGTSQHDAISGNRGYRMGDDFYYYQKAKCVEHTDATTLYMNDKIVTKHADANAAYAIGLRMLTFNTNVYKRSLVKVKEGLAVNAYEFYEEEQSAKRQRGVETRANGYDGTVYKQQPDGGWKVNDSIDIGTILADPTIDKSAYMSVYQIDGGNPTFYEWANVDEYLQPLRDHCERECDVEVVVDISTTNNDISTTYIPNQREKALV